MRGARWRKVRADLTRNRLRSGLAIVSLAVGTTAVGAMVVAGQSVDESFTAGFAAANPPSAVLVTEPFTPDLVDEVAAHPSVGQAEGRRLHQAQATGPQSGALVGSSWSRCRTSPTTTWRSSTPPRARGHRHRATSCSSVPRLPSSAPTSATR